MTTETFLPISSSICITKALEVKTKYKGTILDNKRELERKICEGKLLCCALVKGTEALAFDSDRALSYGLLGGGHSLPALPIAHSEVQREQN